MFVWGYRLIDRYTINIRCEDFILAHSFPWGKTSLKRLSCQKKKISQLSNFWDYFLVLWLSEPQERISEYGQSKRPLVCLFVGSEQALKSWNFLSWEMTPLCSELWPTVRVTCHSEVQLLFFSLLIFCHLKSCGDRSES